MVNPQPASSKYKQGHMPYDVGIVAFFAFFEVCPNFYLERMKHHLHNVILLLYFQPYHQPKNKPEGFTRATCGITHWNSKGSLKRREGTKHGLRQHDWPFSNWRNWSSRFSVSPVWSCGFMAIENVGVVILWWHGCCFKRPWTCSKKKRWIWGIQMVSWSVFLVVTCYDCTCGSIDMFPWADLWNETYSYSYDGNNTCQLRYTKP